jgi:hypothetical protein
MRSKYSFYTVACEIFKAQKICANIFTTICPIPVDSHPYQPGEDEIVVAATYLLWF